MSRGSRNRGSASVGRAIRDAFAEFLLVPTLMITGFLALAALTHVLDRNDAAWLAPLRGFLETHVVADSEAAHSLLETVASGLITITSITVSLLLIALQQSATALTHQVYDQFLRNWRNQVYFGCFVGFSLFALVSLALAGRGNPAVSASLALALAVVALYLLLVLFYTTVDQMRPGVVIEAIHHHALAARERQLGLLKRTRRAPSLDGEYRLPVRGEAHGFVVRIDIDAIAAAAAKAADEVEVVLAVQIGSYIAFGQVLAEVKAHDSQDAQAVGRVLEDAIVRDTRRDIAYDPLDAIDELETIGWTAISTAQSDADAGRLTILALRDLLARWAQAGSPSAAPDVAPIVYPDRALAELLDAFESIAVVASESMQHQSLAEVLRTFDLVYEMLPPAARERVEDILLRSLSALGDHVLTADLESALNTLIANLERHERGEAAAAAKTALRALKRTIGTLGGRATRAAGRG